ncbi:MAG: hypothetical protein ACRDHE_15705 [Ktedonobacterales bacterium]
MSLEQPTSLADMDALAALELVQRLRGQLDAIEPLLRTRAVPSRVVRDLRVVEAYLGRVHGGAAGAPDRT